MFKNNWTLCRFILRRDRINILIWFGVILSLVVGFGVGIQEMYPDQNSLDAMVEMLDSPAFKAMLGHYYLDDGVLTLGGMYSAYMSVWCIMIVGCMSVAIVVKHTRKDEERGRLEVIRSLPVGRLANLSSALTASVILNVILAILIGFGLGAVGAPDRGLDFAGSFALGGACGVFGIIMAGITAIFCQLNKNPGTAMAFSFGFIGLLYMFFMMGAMQGNDGVFLLSVLGLLQSAEFFVANDWLPIFISLIIGAVIFAVAFKLCNIRDLGESLIPERPGKAEAKLYLKSPAMLAWRLLRPWVIFWAVMVPVLSLAYGSVMGDMEAMIESNDIFRKISQGNVMVLSSAFLLVGTIIGALPILHFMLKARSQEKRGYTEGILARSATRSDQLRGYFIIALISAFIVPFLNAAGFWTASTAVMDNPVPFGRWLQACVVYTPALLVLMGVAVALIGWLPKRTGWAWGYLGYTFFALYMGMLMLPEDVADIMAKFTPFGYIPQLPYVEKLGEAPYFLSDGTPLLDADGAQVIMPIFADEATYSLSGGDITAQIVLTVLAIALFAAGFIGYKRREMKFSQ